jgi:hypothetical protein
MPPKGVKTEIIILIGLTALTVAVVLVIVGQGWLAEDSDGGAWTRSTNSANVEGVFIYYTLLERLGYPLARLEEPSLGEALDGTDVLFLVSPAAPLYKEECSALALWVRSGGILVCSPSVEIGLERRRSEVPVESNDEPQRTWAREETGPTRVPEEFRGLSLARNVSSVHFTTSRTLPGKPGESSRGETAPAALLADARGTRIAARRRGRGAVIVLADSSFLANGWINSEDNALLAVNLFAYARSLARGGRAAFDEYHFAGGENEWAIMGKMLLRTSPGWAVLCLAAAGILGLAYKGRRFGVRRNPGRPRRRTKLEFVRAVAGTYRAAGAHRLSFELNFGWFKRQAARRLGLAPSASAGEIASALARRGDVRSARHVRVLQECERSLAQSRWTGRAATRLFRKLALIETEILDGNPSRK